MGIRRGPNIVRDGLELAYDAANPSSFINGSDDFKVTDADGLDAAFDNLPVTKDIIGGQRYIRPSWRGNNMCFINGASWDSAYGGVFTFDGSNDYIRTFYDPPEYAGRAIPDIFSAFTIESWCRPNHTGADRTLWGAYDSQGGSLLYIDVDGAGVGFDWVVRTAGGMKRIGTNLSNVTLNEWHHVVATFDATDLRLYVNNSLQGTVSTGAAYDNTSVYDGFALGAEDVNGGRNWSGEIASLNIYNRVLSATEVAQNYNALKGRFGL